MKIAENLPVDIWLRPCTRISASSQSRADSILNFPPLSSPSLSWFCWLVLLLIYLLGRLCRQLQTTKDLALEEATTDVTGPSSKLVWDCCRTAHCFPSQRLVFCFSFSRQNPINVVSCFQLIFIPAQGAFYQNHLFQLCMVYYMFRFFVFRFEVSPGVFQVWSFRFGCVLSPQFNLEAAEGSPFSVKEIHMRMLFLHIITLAGQVFKTREYSWHRHIR